MRPEDWENRCQHLADGVAYVEAVRADRSKRNQLDRAVWCAWTFGEFAINVCLELLGEELEVHHQQPNRALDLFTRSVLQRDYSKTLQQLHDYRLRADYSQYSTGNTSTHYSTRNVQDCLEQMELLRLEVEAMLRERNRLP